MVGDNVIATELKALLAVLREAGVTHYSGPTLSGDNEVVQLELGPLPVRFDDKKKEPTEAPARGDDGLTQDERHEMYLATGG